MSNTKKYAAIAATLGWTEYEPQEDGLFLQPEEAAAIDAALVTAQENTAALTEALSNLETAAATLLSAQDSLTAANSLAETQAARIAELEEDLVALGGQRSGTGTRLTVDKDEQTTDNKVPSYLDDSNPINQYADKRIKKKATAE